MVDLAGDFLMALDAARLMRAMGIEPDPWQLRLLRTHAQQVIRNCSCQAGKSTFTAGKALHVALFEPGSLVVLLSPGERQSMELLKKCIDQYRALGRPVPADAENKLTLELTNGSCIVALPGKDDATIRGFSGVRLAVCDEAGRVSDTLYQAIRPMLAVSGGQLILLSSPFGKRGFFYQEWTEGGADWERIEVRATEVPRIDPAWLAGERGRIGEWWYCQEYDCQFVQTEDNVFADADIAAMLDPSVKPLFPIEPEASWTNAFSFVGLDIGQAQDYTCITISARQEGHHRWDTWNSLEETTIPKTARAYDVVHLERLPLGLSYPAQIHIIEQRIAAIPRLGLGWGQEPARVCLVVDGTGVGRAVVDLLRAADLHPHAITITGGDTVNFVDGYYRTPKRDIVTCPKILQEQRRIRVAPELPGAAVLMREMQHFKYHIDPKTAHNSYSSWRESDHDDMTLSLGCALWYAEKRDHEPWTQATMAAVLERIAR